MSFPLRRWRLSALFQSVVLQTLWKRESFREQAKGVQSRVNEP